MARKRQEQKPQQPRPQKPRNAGECPACDALVVWVDAEGTITPCEPQRRLLILDYEQDENGLPLEPLTLIEEHTGKVVIGRKASVGEGGLYTANGNPGKPYTVGRKGHLGNCTRWDRWLRGEVRAPARLAPE